MSDFNEALEELGVQVSDSPSEKLRAACQWHLGDPSWAGTFIDWARQAGYVVEEPEQTP